MEQPSLFSDLEEFVTLHRPHDELHAKAGEVTPNGYRLEVACPCGVVFERWVVPDDAAAALAVELKCDGRAPTRPLPPATTGC